MLEQPGPLLVRILRLPLDLRQHQLAGSLLTQFLPGLPEYLRMTARQLIRQRADLIRHITERDPVLRQDTLIPHELSRNLAYQR